MPMRNQTMVAASSSAALMRIAEKETATGWLRPAPTLAEGVRERATVRSLVTLAIPCLLQRRVSAEHLTDPPHPRSPRSGGTRIDQRPSWVTRTMAPGYLTSAASSTS